MAYCGCAPYCFSSCTRLPRTRISSRASHDERRARASWTMSLATLLEETRARARPRWNRSRARSLRARLREGFARRGIRASRRDVVLPLHVAERRGRSRLGRAALAVAIRGERRGDAPQRRRRRAPLRGRRAGRARRAPLLVVSRVDDRGGTPQRISGGDRPPPERGGRAPRRRGRRPRGVRSKPARGDGGGHSSPPGHARGAGSHPMGRRASLRRVALPASPSVPRRGPRIPRRAPSSRHPLAARRRVHPVRHLHARPAPLVRRAAADARVLSVEYPLAPDQGGYVDALRAATDAYRWLVDDAGGGVDPRDVVVGGDSAGGHLALGLVRELATPRAGGGDPTEGRRARSRRVARRGGADVAVVRPGTTPGRDGRGVGIGGVVLGGLSPRREGLDGGGGASGVRGRGGRDGVVAAEVSPRRGSVDARGSARDAPARARAVRRGGGARGRVPRVRRGGEGRGVVGRGGAGVGGHAARVSGFRRSGERGGGGDSVRGGVRGAGHDETSPSRGGDGGVEASVVRGVGGVVRRERMATNADAA